MRSLGFLLVLVGCSPGNPVLPVDGSTVPDAPPRMQGMTVTWNAQPSLPGMVTSNALVTDATFQLEHLQLVSDAGGTTHQRVQLEWSSDGVPPDEVFSDAPVARYQQIFLDMRSDAHPPFSYSYQIEGMWMDNSGNARPFRISDGAVLDISIACDVVLPANGLVTVPVRIDLSNALNGIDFKSLPKDDQGVSVLGPGPGPGPGLSGVRDDLTHQTFSVDQ